MKKIAWIIALIAALSFGFLTCAEPDGSSYAPPRGATEETELTTLFDMQDASNGTIDHGIQELAEGAQTFPSSGGGPIAPLVKAGEIPGHISSFEIVKVGGKNALKYVTVANWGPGFDLPHAAFGFRAGDKITIIGTAEGSTIDLALNRNQGAAQQIIGDKITSAGAFTITVELTAADITAIAGNEQKVIRFEDRVGGTTVTITQIKVEGERPSNITQLEAPVIELSGDTISWSAVTDANGYKVYADTTLLTTVSATSINIYSALGDAEKAAGTYAITVVTGGTVGTFSDSVPSNSVDYAFEPYSVELEVPRDLTQIVTHTNPRFSKIDGWGSSFTFDAINKVTIPANQQANFGYAYPSAAEGLNIGEWDFVKLTLNTTGTYSNFGYKQYPTNNVDANDGRSGALTNTADDIEIDLEIRKIPAGIVFQKYTADANVFSVEITKAVFSKAQRYTVRFNGNGGSTPVSTYLVDGTKVADHLPVPTRAGYIFLGWQMSPGTLVNSTDTVNSAFDNVTLTAQWKLHVVRAPQTVTFVYDEDDPSDDNLFSFVNTDATRSIAIELVNSGAGYKFATTNNGYGNTYAYFTHDFGANTSLSDFNKVTFKYKGISGDIGGKVLKLVVKKAGEFNYIGFDAHATPITTASVTGTDEVSLTLTINQSLASVFDGENVGFAFGIHAGDYSIQITDVVFSQND